jgi:NAD(P)-dependent dehydrogenase (short-subunit alcohol dehydrogenase family)
MSVQSIALPKHSARPCALWDHVNAITPGQIDSRADMLSDEARQRVEAMIPLGKLGHVDDIACAALSLASQWRAISPASRSMSTAVCSNANLSLSQSLQK